MQSVVATFHGLVAFNPRGNMNLALCHPEGGLHKAVLSIPVRNLDLGNTSHVWEPTLVAHDSAGEEIGVWDLSGHRLAFGDAAFGGGTWSNPPASLEAVFLQNFHTNLPLRGTAEIEGIALPGHGQGSIIELTGGSLSWPVAPALRVELNPGSRRLTHPTSVRWESQFNVVSSPNPSDGSRTIWLRDDSPITMRVTNVARVACPTGLTHFAHYYDFFDAGMIAQSNRISLSATTGDLEVFDCVPPTRIS